MKKSIASLLLLLSFVVFSQEKQQHAKEKDTIVYTKDSNIDTERNLSFDLKDKYAGKDFEYTENEPEIQKNSNPINTGFLNFFIFFMSKIFPFLLGGFLIFIILKAFIGFDIRFWKSTNSSKLKKEKLIFEDEDIHEIDLSGLLQNALDQNNFRLAIRYYYLTSLKGLSNKKWIDYHKDKTNSEYVFEIENTDIRSQFSYLSYIYTYVWYGEFPVDEQHFKAAQNKYQSFLKSIH